VIDKKSLSESIGLWDGGDYLITAGICRSRIEHNLHDTFEIGILEKSTGKFKLLQAEWNHQTVQEVANAIASLLADNTQSYTPEWCAEHFK
jgi:hypothetical protein